MNAMNTKLKTALIATAVCLATITACKKDDASTTKTTSNLKNVFAQTRVASQQFTIDGASYQTITGAKGTKIYFFSGSLKHRNGSPVTGNVDIELKEIYSLGDMILSNATTTTTNGRRLESGGELFLKATQGGEELLVNNTNPPIIQFPVNSPVSGMQLFNGRFAPNDSVAQDSTLLWDSIPNGGGQVVQDTVGAGGGFTQYYYQFGLDSFGWSNCDRFWSNTGAGTAVQIKLPNDFDNTNTSVFMIFTAEHTAAPSDTYDATNHICGFHSDGNTPIGISVSIVAISEKNGQYYSSIVSTTTVANMLVTLTMTPTTLADIKTQVALL